MRVARLPILSASKSEERRGDHGGERKHAIEEARLTLCRGEGRRRTGSSVHLRKNLAGKQINGESAEGEDARVEGKAQRHHVPVRRVELQSLREAQLVGLARLPERVPSLGVAFQHPVHAGADHRRGTHDYRQQEWQMPTWLRVHAVRKERPLGPRGRVVSSDGGHTRNRQVDAEMRSSVPCL